MATKKAECAVKVELSVWKRAVVQREVNGWSVAELRESIAGYGMSAGAVPSSVRVFNSWSEAAKFLEKATTVGVS